ncbi:MAG: tRNA threonylcarbamoyladenosine dehydratase [Ruminococcaceae bacterium]|nr:tRNA threonylcarbamoyladenosine dehydratase [Oscillospiraceae bacterium]
MNERFARNAMLFGEEAVERLSRAHVAIVGLGGVGSYAAEAIIRAGVGEVTLVDCDVVSLTNCNRQLCALTSTVGQRKTDVMAARAADINPDAILHPLELRYTPENRETLFAQRFDYIIDCIDTVTSKADLIATAIEREIPILSALGTGNKLHPEQLQFTDIYKTSVCPLARAMRRELRKRGVPKHTVLFSTEEPFGQTDQENGRNYPGSISWVPGAAGLMLAGRVVTELISLPV